MDKESYIKVRLPEEIKTEIAVRAKDLGMSLAGYLRFLAIKDVAEPERKVAIFAIENLDGIISELNKLRFRSKFLRNRV